MTTHEPRFLLPETPTNVGPAFVSAGVVYAIGGLLLALLMWLRPPVPGLTAVVRDPQEFPALIFQNVVGPLGGGGGGGNRKSLLEPRKLEAVPAIKPPEPQPELLPVDEPVPPPEPTPVAAMVPAVANENPIAIVSAEPSAPGSSLGTGKDGAGGAGDSGVGPGRKGGGLGDGDGPNTGDGPGGPGTVDVQVVPLFMPKPAYTSEAVMRRQEGEVTLSCIVLASGNVGTCTVIKSLDGNRYGLDDEALKAAARFVFRPAMRRGQPVPVRVNIVIAFTMR